MATIDLQGTALTCEILKPKLFSSAERVRLKIMLTNAYLRYEDISRTILVQDMEEWIVSMFRLLAGAYAKEYSLAFEGVGLAVDLYPYNDGVNAVSRVERRQNDCVMAIRMLMRSADKKSYLGGVYTMLLHRKEIEIFAQALREEFYKAHPQYANGVGEYSFVGVSPLGYQGCGYWYLDKSGSVKMGDYVWVCMGKHNIKQVVFVDQVRKFTKTTAPYDPDSVKCVLGIVSEVELERWLTEKETGEASLCGGE